MIDIGELEDNAKQELKRADHLLYVTLKYTRTVDVIKNTIKRLINAFDYAILEALEWTIKKKKIKKISDLNKLRAEDLNKVYPEIKTYIDFYNLLKRVDRAEYTKKEEYRKNVTMIVTDEMILEINIPKLKEYFEKTREFVEWVDTLVSLKKK
ncbi:hypothetical protein HYT57_04710 [Candidatus Woesearchaeota archaeon]|nr:hypothetical protein [Candidatus Woesearchaeota archaeon]